VQQFQFGISHTLADVRGEIDFAKLSSTTPLTIRELLRRCLDRDVKNRLRDIGEARVAIGKYLADPARGTRVPEGSVVRPSMLPWAAAGALTLALIAVSFIHFREAAPAGNVLNFSVSLPTDSKPSYLSISPDGRRLVVVLIREAKSQLYVRSLDSSEYRPLPGTDGARMPFWSPDSRSIGFFAERELKKVPAAGGPTTALCSEGGNGRGGTWSRDGVILFSGDDQTLRRVNASGGDCSAVSLEGGKTRAAGPEFLPDGNHYLYGSLDLADPSTAGVYLAALDSPKTRKVLSDYSSVLYSPPATGIGPAHLLFLRETTLMAQPFDLAKLETTGDPFAVAPQAAYSVEPLVAASVARNGTLVYLTDVYVPQQITWFDRSGNELGKIGSARDLLGISLSPDGNTLAISRRDQGILYGIWLFDVARGSESRFTRGAIFPAAVWSPDANRIVYPSKAQPNLFLKDVIGGGKETPLLAPSTNLRTASDWSRDGRFLIYTESHPKTQADIWYLPDPGKPDRKPVLFLGTDAVESQGQLSPDGRWLAYVSDESGRSGVYIRPFPSGPGVWKVAVNGSKEPRWGRDGKELFYLEGLVPKVALMAVAIQLDARSGLQIGAPHRLFEYRGWGFASPNNLFAYSPHPDGKRFLVNVDVEGAKPAINVITNWQKFIAERAP
jgi:eukaryotic-like serine/threonine-protein kinase